MTKLFAGGDDAMQHYMKTIPLGRLGTKWDIAMAVNYLCSEYNSADPVQSSPRTCCVHLHSYTPPPTNPPPPPPQRGSGDCGQLVGGDLAWQLFARAQHQSPGVVVRKAALLLTAMGLHITISRFDV